MRRACWFLILTMLPALAAAQVYRWVDDKGQVHYSQTPPPGKNAQPVGPPPPASASPNQDSLNKSLAEDQAGRAWNQEQADKLAKARADRETQCKQFREQLAFMDQTPPIRMTTMDDKGNVARVSEDQYRQRRAELQKAVDDSCG